MPRGPERIEIVGDFLAVKWQDGDESVISTKTLRTHCPCAHCSGEPDVTGAVRRPSAPPPLTEDSTRIAGSERIGSYAIAFTWGDGHRTGIYSWDLLRELGTLDEG
ncbi:MAG TPA: DUF971 domain-containing protein [Candidatus Krumholzibacteria bacterium]|nr:DUF971 domain-containing protein [Candidatus Krumholzibacteria bacterium]